MGTKVLKSILVFSILFAGCQNTDNSKKKKDEKDFKDDLEFLKKWDDHLVVLTSEDEEAKIIISPKYQAKVLTSTADGDGGMSFGWINYDTFDKKPDPHMNAFGGEDRLWLGPEGGPFSLFFAPGKKMVHKNWHTPAPIDTEKWKLDSSTTQTARLSKDMKLENYAGDTLSIHIDRKVELLNTSAIEDMLSISLGDKINAVGFKTSNGLKNTGDQKWDKKTGMPVLWNLDMFTPSPKTVIVIPFKTDAEGKVATTDYFGAISSDRLKKKDGVLYLKADGKSRDKLGVPPNRVKPIAGSYAADKGVLSIISFDVERDKPYLNQEWTTDKDPFSGDVMNAYNDGPLEDGSQMGPFYEMESVSPAAFLKPGGEMIHHHSVFHFTGDQEALNKIAEHLLGTSLDEISSVFNKN